ncbi:lipocalin family protein [Maribacter sp. 2308TA10-17]|uniref:lipocalin family protein n=1 Tax=Maribacter sp. 2308TA10-17 TaxID=3386276 RepID=UPI0039BD75DD
MKFKKLVQIGILFFITIQLSCSKNEEEKQFFGEAFIEADRTNLLGTWAIFAADFEGETYDVPTDYYNCGNNFFTYYEDGTYVEAVFEDSNCKPKVQSLRWSLDQGVITFSNGSDTDQFVVTDLNESTFVFKGRLDIDEDGDLEELKLRARRYEPDEFDVYTQTFSRSTEDEYDGVIRFTWNKYSGFNQFDRYEIYRGDDGCDTSEMTLIATIRDVNQVSFIDESPTIGEELCYDFIIYTDRGKLEDGFPQSVRTSDIEVPAIEINEPVINGNQITVNWEPYSGNYFSHYLITVNNRVPYFGNLDTHEIVLTQITDKELTTFIDENPPYFADPVYTVRVYNIFGRESFLQNDNYSSSQQVSYKRKELIGFQDIDKLTIHDSEPAVYIYGREANQIPARFKLQKYNYQTNLTEAVATEEISTSFGSDMKLFNSNYGKELLVQQGNSLYAYDALDLGFKYEIKSENVFFTIDDFQYMGDDLYVFIDTRELNVFKRENDNLVFIDRQSHDIENGNYSGYKLIAIDTNRFLAGHHNSTTSILYELNTDGTFAENVQTTPVAFASNFRDKTIFNAAQNIILNSTEKILYSANTLSVLENLTNPNFPSGISADGNLILGSNNDPKWRVERESLHQKEAIIFNRESNSVQFIPTIGYPLLLFENHLGQIISISSGIKRERLSSFTEYDEIFIETVEIP